VYAKPVGSRRGTGRDVSGDQGFFREKIANILLARGLNRFDNCFEKDTLWYYLENVEKMSRDQIRALLTSKSEEPGHLNLKQFPKKKRS